MGDNFIDNISKILKENSNIGLTITELVKISGLSRSLVRILLARLEGAGKVDMRKIGMAKVYSLKEKKETKAKRIMLSFFLLITVFLVSLVMAQDTFVWQGQYYTGTTFNKGTYLFNFSVYDSFTGGNLCYSNTTMLSTGDWGEWKTEQSGVSSACNNVSKSYFVDINIEGVSQIPRRRLTMFNFLRKDADEIVLGGSYYKRVP